MSGHGNTPRVDSGSMVATTQLLVLGLKLQLVLVEPELHVEFQASVSGGQWSGERHGDLQVQ